MYMSNSLSVVPQVRLHFDHVQSSQGNIMFRNELLLVELNPYINFPFCYLLDIHPPPYQEIANPPC